MEWRSESLGPSCPNAPSFHYGGSPLDPAGLGLSSSMIEKKIPQILRGESYGELVLKKSAHNPRQSCLISGKLVRTKDVYKCRKTFSYNKVQPRSHNFPHPQRIRFANLWILRNSAMSQSRSMKGSTVLSPWTWVEIFQWNLTTKKNSKDLPQNTKIHRKCSWKKTVKLGIFFEDGKSQNDKCVLRCIPPSHNVIVDHEDY